MPCYASCLGDCKGKITNEHYISRSVLELAGINVRISGFPWVKNGSYSNVGINSLVSKVLCQSHNSDLSSLDSIGKSFVSNLKAIFENVESNGEFIDENWIILGNELELWLLKILCGTLAAINKGAIPTLWVEYLFQKKTVPDNSGMYIFGMDGRATWYFNIMRVIPVLDKNNNIAGAKFGLGGLAFLLAFGEPNFSDHSISSMYRPSSLIVKKGENVKSINFSWMDSKKHGSLEMILDQSDQSEVVGTKPIVLPDGFHR